jgi:putative addiction module component (TIGR02574 family)
VKSRPRLTNDLEGLMLDTVSQEGGGDHRGRMTMRIGKQALRDLVEDLPEEVEIDDVLDRIYLLESLETKAEEGVEEAWRKEIERRMAELDEGVVEPVSWEEVQARVFGRSRGQSGS